MTLQQALEQWVEGRDISRDAMRAVMTTVMTGAASQAQIGALLVALRMKGEAIEEIAGAAEVMRELVTPVSVYGDHVIDLVGTGGDGANLFNVSTAATFVAAAAGAQSAIPAAVAGFLQTQCTPRTRSGSLPAGAAGTSCVGGPSILRLSARAESCESGSCAAGSRW